MIKNSRWRLRQFSPPRWLQRGSSRPQPVGLIAGVSGILSSRFRVDFAGMTVAEAIFKQKDRHCERSEAIHRATRKKGGLLRFARNDAKDMSPRSRRMCCARFGLLVRPSPIRGRRECRAPDAPENRACRDSGREHTRSQVTPESPGIPRAMVYGLYRALPGDRLSCHRRRRSCLHRLDTSVGVSGPHVYILVFGETRRS